MFILFSQKKLTVSRDMISYSIPLAIVFILVTIPLALLYSKSLIFERYHLPVTLAASMLILFRQEYINRNPSSLILLSKTFLPGCIILLLMQVFLMIRGAIAYAETGFEKKDMLNSIMQNTKQNNNILIVEKP